MWALVFCMGFVLWGFGLVWILGSGTSLVESGTSFIRSGTSLGESGTSSGESGTTLVGINCNEWSNCRN